MKKIDLTGQRFGRLVVIREAGRAKDRQIMWLCRCDCGGEVIVRSVYLRRGDTRSCGCLCRERACDRCTSHGCANEPWYPTYHAMMVRCGHRTGASERKLLNYRDRGVTVCDEWRNSPRAFGDWLLAHGWRKGLQIDRIDNSKGYSPENCRVVTCKENNNNKRNTVRLNDGTSLAMFCSSIGIETYEGGKVTKKYGRIRDMWSDRHKIHPELTQALRESADNQSRLLEITKLKCRHAELLISAYKELLASKQTA